MAVAFRTKEWFLNYIDKYLYIILDLLLDLIYNEHTNINQKVVFPCCCVTKPSDNYSPEES